MNLLIIFTICCIAAFGGIVPALITFVVWQAFQLKEGSQ